MKITLTGPQSSCRALHVRRDSPLMILPGETVSYQAYFPPTSAGTFTYTVPSGLLPPVRAIGFDMAVDAGFNGGVYIDDIAW